MKKRLFALITALIMTASSVIFAADANTLKSIYASKETQQRITECLADSLKSYDISLDTDSIMPLYEGSLLEYGKSGVLSLTPMRMDGMECYVADVTDNSGKYAGTVQIKVDTSSAEAFMVALRTEYPADAEENLSVLSPVLDEMNTTKLSVKLAFIEGIGYVYALADEQKTILTSASVKAPRSEEVIPVDGTLLEQGKALAKEAEEWQQYLETLPEEENPPTGAI